MNLCWFKTKSRPIPLSTPESPRQIARFQIVELMGRGGFSEVYRAYDPTLNRDVALKVLASTSRISDEAIVRFQREAQAAGILNHPNIVPVFEQGVVDGQRFIVSELCDGPTLKSWFEDQNRQTSPTAAAKIVVTLAEAVNHAHQRGVIHRDLKPANIMLNGSLKSENSQAGPLLSGIRITDFGLAKHTTKTDLMETTEGAIVGTPAYMSPEQARGESQIGNGSDIYSLGVILYEQLTGKVPILKSTHIDTLLAINSSQIKPPRKLNPEIPRDLESICLKCLNKSTADRYATAMELSADLNRWLSGEVVHARRVTHVERAFKWCARNSIVTSLMATLAIASIFSVWQWRQSSANFDLATEQATLAEKQKSLAESQTLRSEEYLQSMTEIVDKFLLDFEQYGDSALVSKLQKTRLEEILELQRALIEEEKSSDAIKNNKIRTFRRMSSIQLALGRFEQLIATSTEARQWLSDQDDWIGTADDGLEKEFIAAVIDIGLGEARSLNLINRSQEAVESVVWTADVFNTNRELFDELEQKRLEIKLGTYLGFCLEGCSKFKLATTEFETAAVVSEELLLINASPDLDCLLSIIGNFISLGNRKRYDEDFETALHYLQTAVDLSDSENELRKNELPNLRFLRSRSLALSSFASILTAMGRRDEAERASLEALKPLRLLVKQVPKSNHFQVSLAEGLRRHAKLLRWRKEYLPALYLIDESTKLRELGLDETLYGKLAVVNAQTEKAEIFGKIGLTRDAEIAARHAVDLSIEFFHHKPEYKRGITATANAWIVLLDATIRLNRSEKVLEIIPLGLKAIENAELNNHGTHYFKTFRIFRIHYTGQKSNHLAKLRRWEEAIAAVYEVLELESVRGPKPAPSYYEAARNMSVVLDRWAKAVESPDEESYNEAMDQAFDWLQLAITEDGYLDREYLLNNSQFQRVREHERYQKIVDLID